MGIWCDIPSHPTRPRPLPKATRTYFFNTFLPAKRTNRVADLQKQLFSLFFLYSSKYHCPQQVSRSEDYHLRESFSETAKIVSKNTHVRKRFCFSTPYYCAANPPTDHSQQHVLQFVRQCSAYMSTLSAHPLKIQARTAAINGSTTCGRGFGWGNGCGLLRSNQISHQKPLSFFFSRGII